MNELKVLLRKLQVRDRGIRVEDHSIPGFRERIAVRLYSPAKAAGSLPGVLYFHGGGFVRGSLDDADIPARHLASSVPAAVLAVSYSLAGAHPFPAAVEDAFAALRWLHRNAAGKGIDAKRIAVGGDDAGGNIAAVLAFMARDRNGPAIAAQVLIGPMLDPSLTTTGDAERLKSDIDSVQCAECYARYLPSIHQRLHPYASPMLSRRLHGLPPAWISTAEQDVLHVEAERYAAALIEAGVPTQITRYPVNHRELATYGVQLEDIGAFLRQKFQGCCHSAKRRRSSIPDRQNQKGKS